MAKEATITESRTSAVVTIGWYGKYALFEIASDETLDTFLTKLGRRISIINEPLMSNEGFYMLILGTPTSDGYEPKELCYIGKAYGQTLAQRIPQKGGHEEAFKCIIEKGKGLTLYIAIGLIAESSLQNATTQQHDDIECCLIFTNKPTCNKTCKDSFNLGTRRELSITNTGKYVPLKEKSVCY